MADPVVVVFVKGVWKKLITNEIAGYVHRMDASPAAYYQTTRLAGEAAPVQVDPLHAAFDGVLTFKDANKELKLLANEPTDLYMLTIDKPGKVRVDV